MDEYDYTGLPEHIRHGARRYVEHHEAVGGFLTSVFQNDLVAAVGRADEENMQHLREIVTWVYNEPPEVCWGSREKVLTWLSGGPRLVIMHHPSPSGMVKLAPSDGEEE